MTHLNKYNWFKSSGAHDVIKLDTKLFNA